MSCYVSVLLQSKRFYFVKNVCNQCGNKEGGRFSCYSIWRRHEEDCHSRRDNMRALVKILLFVVATNSPRRTGVLLEEQLFYESGGTACSTTTFRCRELTQIAQSGGRGYFFISRVSKSCGLSNPFRRTRVRKQVSHRVQRRLPLLRGKRTLLV